MIAVSNTSPLTNLAAIGQFDLLHRVFGQVYISDAVWSELNAQGKRWPGSLEVENAAWIVRQRIQNQPLVTALAETLIRARRKVSFWV
jgi:predicted nucleic acid-binding protein